VDNFSPVIEITLIRAIHVPGIFSQGVPQLIPVDWGRQGRRPKISPASLRLTRRQGAFPRLCRLAVSMRVSMPPGLCGKAKHVRCACGGLALASGAAWPIRATAAPARQGRQSARGHERANMPRPESWAELPTEMTSYRVTQ